MGEGLWVWWRHWAESSQLHCPTFPHQPAYPSKKGSHPYINTACTCHLDEGKSTAALFVKLDCHCSLSWQSTPTHTQVYYCRMSSLNFSNLISHLPFTAETPGGLEVPLWVHALILHSWVSLLFCDIPSSSDEHRESSHLILKWPELTSFAQETNNCRCSWLITTICTLGPQKCQHEKERERARDKETEWLTNMHWGGMMETKGDRERWYLACLLIKGYRAEAQIAYSHERICNEKQYVTKLNSHITCTHTHTLIHIFTQNRHTQKASRDSWHSTFMARDLTISVLHKQILLTAY